MPFVSKEVRELTKVEVTKPNATPVDAPRDVFSAMPGEIDGLFERFELGFARLPTLFGHRTGDDALVLPEIDVHDNGTTVPVEAELLGVAEKEVTVALADGVLTIKGEKHENYYLAERSYGAFERSVRLPDGIDETTVEASFDKGVLKITGAKRPEAIKAAPRSRSKKHHNTRQHAVRRLIGPLVLSEADNANYTNPRDPPDEALRAAIHPPGPDRDNKLEYQHGFEWRQAARIAFVVIATAAVWSETWEPLRGIGLIGGIGLLVEGWPILTEAFDHLLARRMTMELSIVRRLHRGPLRMFLDPDARLRQS